MRAILGYNGLDLNLDGLASCRAFQATLDQWQDS